MVKKNCYIQILAQGVRESVMYTDYLNYFRKSSFEEVGFSKKHMLCTQIATGP